ncbi:hypothetical protein LJB93_02595 [Desulfovibrio sp. OttesenSCG-928-F07]|nr:hypothetical protein [Desulfovibrio sp. OttesenSCG-928-F07]
MSDKPLSMFEDSGPRAFTPEEEEQKRFMYDKMAPRRKRFIDRIGYDKWDPFQAPKDPMDIRVDVTQRTTQELVRDFLQTRDSAIVNNDYSRGVLECALGVINKDEKFRGIFEFCLWYQQQIDEL